MSTVRSSTQSKQRNQLLKDKNFLLLWLGGTVSQFGDMFYLIALPWLVLVITDNNALALGSIMAAAAIPRALFMVLGGVVSDRVPAKTILLISAAVRALLVGLLAVLVLLDVIQLWMLFVISLGFGFADAFAGPAALSLLPKLLPKENLAAANALFSGAYQVSGILGPAVAGFFIAYFGSDISDTSTAANSTGIAAAFVFDAFSFVVVTIALWLLRLPKATLVVGRPSEGLFSSLVEGFRFVFAHTGFRVSVLLSAVINLAMTGPLIVGLPILARLEFGGAQIFGLLMSAQALGLLIGYALAGTLPKPTEKTFGTTVVSMAAIAGFCLIGVSVAPEEKSAMVALLIANAFNGYGNILMITWFQTRTPEHLLGRVMGIVMTVSGGLAPISMAVTGFLVGYFDVRLVLGVAAASMSIIALLGLTLRSIREMDVEASQLVADNV